MKTTWKALLPLLVVVMFFFATDARADAAGPGSCFGSNEHNDFRKDAGGDAKDELAQGPSRGNARRTGISLLSAAFLTSGWLFFRRKS